MYLILLKIPPNRYLISSLIDSNAQLLLLSSPIIARSSLSKISLNYLLRNSVLGETSELISEDDSSRIISGGICLLMPRDFFISWYLFCYYYFFGLMFISLLLSYFVSYLLSYLGSAFASYFCYCFISYFGSYFESYRD